MRCRRCAKQSPVPICMNCMLDHKFRKWGWNTYTFVLFPDIEITLRIHPSPRAGMELDDIRRAHDDFIYLHMKFTRKGYEPKEEFIPSKLKEEFKDYMSKRFGHHNVQLGNVPPKLVPFEGKKIFSETLKFQWKALFKHKE